MWIRFAWICSLFIVLLASGEAQSAGPSFNCSKSKRPDEIAICRNVVLSENDLETTRLFELMKKQNRAGAIAIAKAFLKARRACGGNAICIGQMQTAAIMTFNQNLPGKEPGGRPSADADQTKRVEAEKPTDTRGAGTPNPWPDAYARRDFKLGMSIADFKTTPYPDENEAPGAYPVCSDESRTSELQYLEAKIYDEMYKKAGMIKCVFFSEVKFQSGSSTLSSGVGIAGTRMNTDFYFIPDDRGIPRLFWIVTTGPADSFSTISSAMNEAYGQPIRTIEKWQNKMGAMFDNEVLEWRKGGSRILFRHFGSDLRAFILEHRLDPLMQKLDDASKKDIAEKAKQL